MQSDTVVRGDIVLDRDKRSATVLAIEEHPIHGAQLQLQCDDGRQITVPRSLLFRDAQAPCAQLPLCFADLPQHTDTHSEQIVIPVLAEQARVSTRRKSGRGVRVTKTMRTRQETVNVPLREEHWEVARVAVGRAVDPNHLPQPRQQGDTLIVPVLEEVLVVNKVWRLKEEIHLTRSERQIPHTQAVTLHAEQANVEHFDAADDAADAGGPAAPFRTDAPSSSPSGPGAGTSPQETIMANTLVGVYENSADAQATYDELKAAGFGDDALQISSAPDSTTARRDADSGEQSFGASVRSFFHRIFGNEQREHADVYSEAMRRGHCLVTVDADSDDASDRALQVMNRHNAIDIEERALHWRSSGWSGFDENAPRMNESEVAQDRARYGADAGKSLPVIEEQLQVGKREVQRGGVRIFQRVHETPVEESVRLREDHVNVERRPVDQPATPADLKAAQDGSFEVRETIEEPVVAKSARVVEEVVVSKDSSERTATVGDTVRRTDVEVEPLAAGGSERGDDEFRRHFQSNYAASGDSYEDYADAYRYGSTRAADERYRGYRWDDAEPQVRKDWESQNATPWDKAKSAVRYGWERLHR